MTRSLRMRTLIGSVLLLAVSAAGPACMSSRAQAQRAVVHSTRTHVHSTQVNRNVNVHVDAHYDRWGHPIARAAAVTATAVAVGTIVASLPPRCTAVVTPNVTYQNCGGVYYKPVYQGTVVQYIVVNQP